ncbi:MAG: hypothetical protein HY023_19285 [Chloroflexi bacterium]|nr:hypothetical protein [Chloroflexota bacterium]MBI3761963.1 hypothetical protein [Chloroflexota bacterium]
MPYSLPIPTSLTAEIPRLEIVPTESLVVHEQNDNQRTGPLVARLEAEGMIKNPPIIASMGEDDPRYVVLDGANRTTALSQMGYPHALAQVVDYESEAEVNLATWHHVVAGMDAETFTGMLATVEGLEYRPTDYNRARAALARRELVSYIVSASGMVFAVRGGSDLHSRCLLLNQMVDSYKEHGRIYRSATDHVAQVRNLYEDLTALVVFPHHEPAEILELARVSAKLPAGITRHIINRRALRVNYPLAELKADRPIEEKRERLNEWIKAKLAAKEIRYYPESTYLFDE